MRKPKIQMSAEAIVLNRWITYQTNKYYSRRSQKTPVRVESFHVIQWASIWADIRDLFRFPTVLAPRVAFSLLAFWFIAQGRHQEAQHTAFELPLMMGALAYDTANESTHSGEPNPVSVTVTVANVADRIALMFAAGFNAVPTVTFDGNATTGAHTAVGNLRSYYYIAPGTGSKSASFSGGAIKACGVVIYDGAHQTTPIGNTVTEDGTSSPNDMSLTTTVDGAVRFDALGALRDDATSPSMTLDAGTNRCDPVTPQNQFRMGLSVYTNDVATAGATTRTWTTSAFNRWYAAFELKPAAGASSNIKKLMGVTQANLKVVAGVSEANVKKVAGITN